MNEEIEIEKRLARQYRRVAHRHKGLVRFPDEFRLCLKTQNLCYI